MQTEYRGHLIRAFAIADRTSSFRSGYTVRRTDDIDAEAPLLRASLDGASATQAEAFARATRAARIALDALLNVP